MTGLFLKLRNASSEIAPSGNLRCSKSGSICSSKRGNLSSSRHVKSIWDDSLSLASSKWQPASKQAYSVSVVYKDINIKLRHENKQDKIP